ncbi:hypothetical protein DE167_001623 [Clostridium beijerinckii]|nr:hypothetical protein [Clostridium beijerinckii]
MYSTVTEIQGAAMRVEFMWISAEIEYILVPYEYENFAA